MIAAERRYKEVCGIYQDNSRNRQIGLRFEEELFQKISDRAKVEDKSFSSMVRVLCREALNGGQRS